MNKAQLNFLLSKYAITLSIAYAIALVWVFISHRFFTVGETYSSMEFEMIASVPFFTTSGINIIVAIMTAYDMKKISKINWLIVIITALFGFFGVGLFFIYLFHHVLIAKDD